MNLQKTSGSGLAVGAWGAVHTTCAGAAVALGGLLLMMAVGYRQTLQRQGTESGITTDVGIRIFGSDPEVLAQEAARAEAVLATIPGAADVKITAASAVK